ncbi:uroporphyrin-3 C-methyltransferase [Pseudidiomarina planktonica]|uniref:Uroporphyrin-3 C-methyltransferase n=1 Tax=Pseudidiomarina planktonica TaxID=1323738 RepID=A0A1Y6G1V0_9GAMM|nr:uroporphyrinogen-III C-methyltransferase [Pseudidiomarina planktonica]SMQ79833.1 uroporphyrin-3 C-methyltransferase [Pseudidiomarina planktonica]
MTKETDKSAATTTEAKAETKKSATGEAPSKAPEKEPKRAVKSSRILPWLLLIIVIAALAAGGWFGYPHWQAYQQSQQQIQQQLASYNDQIAALESKLSQLEREQSQQANRIAETPESLNALRQSLRGELRQQQTELNNQARALGSLQSELANLDMSQESSWRIIEARNLAAMAGRKVWLESDINTAIRLLELADSHLRALDNPVHIPVRQALRDDIDSLTAIAQVDTDAIVIRLTSVAEQLNALNWQQAPGFNGPDATETETDTTTWQQNLANSWKRFMQQFVRIQQREEAVEPLLSHDFVRVVQQRLQLSLQLAQLAAVAANDERYQAALEQAQSLLAEYAPAQSNAVKQAQQTLLDLQQQQLEQAKPSTLQSIELLQQLAANNNEEASA